MYEFSVQLVDSQFLSRSCDPENPESNWVFKGVQNTLARMSSEGWEHYQSLEIAGSPRWRPNNASQHGILLFFRRLKNVN